MNITSTMLRGAGCLLGAAVLSSAASAAITTYTSQAAMTAATTMVATDSFNSLRLDFLSSPATRTIGAYSYAASAPGGLYGTGSSGDVWLSTDLAGDVLTFGGFTGGVRALGGLFFGTGSDGLLLAGQTLVVTATDSGGATASMTLANATTASFAGFVSTVQLTQVQVSIQNLNGWVAANNLALGGATAPVPEPASWALWMAGLACAGGVAARRRGRLSG